MKEPPAIDVAQRQMRHPDIANVPHRRLLRAAIHALAEEGQLEAEAPAFSRVQIAGVVPPLGLKIGMIEVIARKFVVIAGKREPSPRSAISATREVYSSWITSMGTSRVAIRAG